MCVFQAGPVLQTICSQENEDTSLQDGMHAATQVELG